MGRPGSVKDWVLLTKALWCDHSPTEARSQLAIALQHCPDSLELQMLQKVLLRDLPWPDDLNLLAESPGACKMGSTTKRPRSSPGTSSARSPLPPCIHVSSPVSSQSGMPIQRSKTPSQCSTSPAVEEPKLPVVSGRQECSVETAWKHASPPSSTRSSLAPRIHVSSPASSQPGTPTLRSQTPSQRSTSTAVAESKLPVVSGRRESSVEAGCKHELPTSRGSTSSSAEVKVKRTSAFTRQEGVQAARCCNEVSAGFKLRGQVRSHIVLRNQTCFCPPQVVHQW